MTVALVVLVAVAAGAVGYCYGRWRAHRAVRETRPAEPQAPRRPTTDEVERQAVERALADLRLGVVVVGADGAELYRNNRGKQFATGRHGDALVEAALHRTVDGALLGLSIEEEVEVYGPPARSLLVQASPTYEGGEPSGAICVIDDVTEARHVDRVRSDFVANVSHELRTPVGAMSVLAETLAGTDDPEVIERLATRMQREAIRLGDTIEDLLALSRLESGPVEDPETIDLTSVATMAIERTAEAAKQTNVLVGFDNRAGGPVLIDGDQGQLVSAVANLIDNAVKYSDAGGSVRVALARTSPADDGLPMVELTIRDEGIGIPERDLDRIFERFYRVDTARSRDTGGTGLGLSIVRHALMNHRGTIDVTSTEGIGSTFVVRLPLSAVDQRVGSPSHEATADRSEEIGHG